MLAGNFMLTNVIAYLHTTLAYQSAVMQLMVGQANLDAQQLHLREPLPVVVPADTNTWKVAMPPDGVTGRLVTPHYVYQFVDGRQILIQIRIQPHGVAENQPSLIDTNQAWQLARQWLSALSVDVSALDEKYPHSVESLASRTRNRPNESPHRSDEPARNHGESTNNVIHRPPPAAGLPIFRVTWGGARIGPATSRATVQVAVDILGSTKQCLSLHVFNRELFTGPPLTVTNAAALLGPLPSPQQVVQDFLGGQAAYTAVANPDRVSAWLLSSSPDAPETKTIRSPVMVLNPATAPLLSQALTDFNSYAWLRDKGCTPDYGVGLRFSKGAENVDVLWCYNCDHLQVIYNGRSADKDCDAARPALVRAIQSVFPNDPVIRSLSLLNSNQPK